MIFAKLHDFVSSLKERLPNYQIMFWDVKPSFNSRVIYVGMTAQQSTKLVWDGFRNNARLSVVVVHSMHQIPELDNVLKTIVDLAIEKFSIVLSTSVDFRAISASQQVITVLEIEVVWP